MKTGIINKLIFLVYAFVCAIAAVYYGFNNRIDYAIGFSILWLLAIICFEIRDLKNEIQQKSGQ